MGQISFEDLFAEQAKEKRESTPTPLYKEILALIESEISSALEICECLIESGQVSNERYSSNKPKAYPKICSLLDEMVQQGNVIFIADKNKKDRIYRLNKK
ncbi:DUF3895 domain-containing protein [Peribacillus loiseleuriae]|uniref:DUF3895 domain-containing protein n=1 Tax=Peribacillus loiseleuriae TaxID=1679170 RepID=A0A0K9GU56_9BACI|nr:DUF3895 domain-containing protein [Peribacillus loiseleuriae]KMY50180.1 hypothetical protein AC625_12265 [Peribacillus loiseleuriae]